MYDKIIVWNEKRIREEKQKIIKEINKL